MEHTFSILPDRKSKNAPMRHNSVAGINFSGKSAVSKISYWVLYDYPMEIRNRCVVGTSWVLNGCHKDENNSKLSQQVPHFLLAYISWCCHTMLVILCRGLRQEDFVGEKLLNKTIRILRYFRRQTKNSHDIIAYLACLMQQ